MIQLTSSMRILLAVDPVDFRKGIDGLVGVCRNILKKDPFSGYVFAFRNRSGTSLKILAYDGQGFWLCQKRFSTGRLKYWPRSAEGGISLLAARELQVLIWNGIPDAAGMSPDWRRVCSGSA